MTHFGALPALLAAAVISCSVKRPSSDRSGPPIDSSPFFRRVPFLAAGGASSPPWAGSTATRYGDSTFRRPRATSPASTSWFSTVRTNSTKLFWSLKM